MIYGQRLSARDNLIGDPAVMDERNGVFLIDRRKIVPGTRLYHETSDYPIRGTLGRRHYWMVLDYSDTNSFGDWVAHKTLKEARRMFEHNSQLRPTLLLSR
jgi:hypothetical protein